MTQQYRTHINWAPHCFQATIILLINVNISVSATNGGQQQPTSISKFNISTGAPRISSQVGVQVRTESAHLPVDRPIGSRPRPSRAVISRAPRGMGTAQNAHPISPRALPCQDLDRMRSRDKVTKTEHARLCSKKKGATTAYARRRTWRSGAGTR